MKITILGCGSSAGVPVVGCDCAVCTSDNPKNTRSRVSIAIEQGGTRLLIDASPDLRQQALANHITQVDALAITHSHADHCHGLDDMRPFNYHKNQVIPTYSDAKTMTELKERFAYAFEPPIPNYGWFRPALEPHIVDLQAEQPVHLSDELAFTPFLQHHGRTPTMGLRVGHFAYSTDVNKLDEEVLQALENVDVWVVDCLRHTPAPTHAHLELTLQWIERVKPNRAILTHMSHDLDYDELRKQLPGHVEPAYDGMVIECDY